MIAASVCGLPVASCNDVSGPDTVFVGATGLPVVEQPLVQGQSSLRAATIGLYAESDIAVPATARVGEPVTLRVTTYSGGCIGEDKTEVRTVGQEADIVPYQRIYSPKAGQACTSELRITPRAVSLVFMTVGTATVTIAGRVRPDSGIVRVVRTVVVR